MPITLTVRNDDSDTGPSLTFDSPRVVVGRGPGCDVRLPDSSVSQRHAVLRAKGPDYQILDEGSTNGTWVGGVRLAPKAPRTLRSGDLVRVGRVWLEVRIDQTAPTPDLALATRDLALALVQNAMRLQGADTAPKVSVLEGAPEDMSAALVLREEGRAYVVGRAASCDLPLADVDASREHLQIARRGATVLVRDLGSKNGTLLGEQALSQNRDVPWRAAVMIRVGATVLALDEPVAEALGELEAMDDEPMQPGETPAPPSSAKPEPPPSARGVAAPIARVEGQIATATTRKRSPMKSADIAIIGSAVAIIALSIAALVWVLR